MSRPRDSYRSKVYAAESAVYGAPCDGMVPDLPELSEVVTFVREVGASEWWPRIWLPRVTDGRGSRRPRAFPGQSRISMPRFARTRCMVIHEMAHLIQPRHEASHGQAWVKLYLTGLRDVIGGDTARRLSIEFARRNVPGAGLPGTYSNGS